jgi:hypothetical protein
MIAKGRRGTKSPTPIRLVSEGVQHGVHEAWLPGAHPVRPPTHAFESRSGRRHRTRGDEDDRGDVADVRIARRQLIEKIGGAAGFEPGVEVF